MQSKPGARAVFNFLQWCLTAVARRFIGYEHPRPSSNKVLRTYLRHVGGEIINISGWEDSDKQGAHYRDYFGRVDRYVISNIGGQSGMPAAVPAGVESVYLDLEHTVPDELRGRFDVVFSHTVLEHIYTVHEALETMAALTRDLVVTVVPFSQCVHYTHSFSDYLRPSPFYLKRFFEERGFTVLLSTANDQPFFPVYFVFIVSRHPERHREAFKNAPVSFDIQILPARWGKFGVSGLMSGSEPD